jgi:hypothetical protein
MDEPEPPIQTTKSGDDEFLPLQTTKPGRSKKRPNKSKSPRALKRKKEAQTVQVILLNNFVSSCENLEATRMGS